VSWIRATVRRVTFQQISKPRGWLAPVTARILNRINARHNDAVVGRLSPNDAMVVDVGFGGGIGLAALLQHPERVVVGIDPSMEMIRHCRRQFRTAIDNGRLTLVQGVAEQLPLPANSVNAVVTVHSVYYWSDLSAGLRETARVVTDTGICIVGVGPNANAHAQRLGLGAAGFRAPSVEDIAAVLRDVGFRSTSIDALNDFTILTGRT
jgi:SAM-dependent methyltransferase